MTYAKLNKRDRRELDQYDFNMQVELLDRYQEIDFDVNDYYFNKEWGYLISRLPTLDSQVKI